MSIEAVRAIIADVRARGDAALLELTQRFDRLDLAKTGIRVTDAEIGAAVGRLRRADAWPPSSWRMRASRATTAASCPSDDRYTRCARAPSSARAGRPSNWSASTSRAGWPAIQARVLMNAVPARVAGVPRVAMVVPSPDGEMNPLVLAAAHLAGVTEIYRIGGAQAVAALAFGTETIAPVVKIVGPGNAYVAAAKRQVYGTVGIDSIAGPSEVLVIADKHNDPEWLAADLLAQAEHDTAAQAILMTDDAGLAGAVEAAVERQLEALPRGNIAGESWATFGAVILVRSLDEAPALADRIAAEHLEIATARARGAGRQRSAMRAPSSSARTRPR